MSSSPKLDNKKTILSLCPSLQAVSFIQKQIYQTLIPAKPNSTTLILRGNRKSNLLSLFQLRIYVYLYTALLV